MFLKVVVLLEVVGLVELNVGVEYVVLVEFVVVFQVHPKIHVCMLLLIVMFVIHV